MLLLLAWACRGPTVIPYQPPVNSAVGDEQLDQLEFEARAESQMPGMAAGFRVDLPAMNLYTSAYDLGLGAGLTERGGGRGGERRASTKT